MLTVLLCVMTAPGRLVDVYVGLGTCEGWFYKLLLLRNAVKARIDGTLTCCCID